jgi:hypothetical protein
MEREREEAWTRLLNQIEVITARVKHVPEAELDALIGEAKEYICYPGMKNNSAWHILVRANTRGCEGIA